RSPCRRTRAPRRSAARRKDRGARSLLHLLLHFMEALHRLALAEVLELEVRPHLDLALHAVEGRREALAPRKRLLARAYVDDGVAGDELLRLGEGAVHDAAAAVLAVPDAPALRGRLQARGVHQDAGLHQLLVVLAHLGEERLRGHHARLGIARRLYQDHEFHAFLLSERKGLHPLVEPRRRFSTSAAQLGDAPLEEAPLRRLARERQGPLV